MLAEFKEKGDFCKLGALDEAGKERILKRIEEIQKRARYMKR